MSALLAWLDGVDRALLLLLNRSWTSALLDVLMPTLTDPHRERWIVYGAAPVALGAWLWKDGKRALRVLVLAALALGAADLVAYRVVKPLVSRPRPNHAVAGVIQRAPAGGAMGFPSNHAANAAAAAAVAATAYPAYRLLFWALAALVAYSRVYCGVHYPGDVLAGLALGALIGLPWARLMLGAGSGGGYKSKRR